MRSSVVDWISSTVWLPVRQRVMFKLATLVYTTRLQELHIYIYIYIYMCVCVCVCVFMFAIISDLRYETWLPEFCFV